VVSGLLVRKGDADVGGLALIVECGGNFSTDELLHHDVAVSAFDYPLDVGEDVTLAYDELPPARPHTEVLLRADFDVAAAVKVSALTDKADQLQARIPAWQGRRRAH
jgi:hypothetical protein